MGLSQLGWLLIAIVPLCLIVAAAFDLFARVARRWSAAKLYRAARLALLAVAASPLIVLYWQATPPPRIDRGAQDLALIDAPDESVDDVITEQVSQAASSVDEEAASESPSILGNARLHVADRGLERLAVLWLVITGILFGRLVLTYPLLRSELRNASPMYATDAEKFDELATKLGVLTPITWLETPHRKSPLVVGWWRPTIVIPRPLLDDFSAEEAECLVLHELAHVHYRDGFWNTILQFTRLAFLYQPHVVRLVRQAVTYRECRCDDLAVSHVGDRLLFARTLRRLLQEDYDPVPFELAAQSAVGERIERLLPRRADKTGMWMCAVSLLMLAGGLLLVPHVARASRTSHQSSRPILENDNGPSVVVDRDIFHVSEVQTDGRIMLPEHGRLVFHSELSAEELAHWTVEGLRGRTTVVQVRSITGIRLFIRASWPDSATTTTSDTDGGSGRGGDCLLIIPGHPNLDEFELTVTNVDGTPGRFFVLLWQSQLPADIDANHIGTASSLLHLDYHLRAQIPTNRNMQPPAIDYPNDVDTYQIWFKAPGELLISVDGYRGRIRPFVRLFDNRGIPLHEGVFNEDRYICRVKVQHTKPGGVGYYIAVTSWDHRPGEYFLQAHLD